MVFADDDPVWTFDEIINAANDTTLLDEADMYLARARVSIAKLRKAVERARY